jgi:hypothetical protein
VVAVVADARRECSQGALVVEGNPRCLIDELAVDPTPELAGGGRLTLLQRMCTPDLGVDGVVAELGQVEVGGTTGRFRVIAIGGCRGGRDPTGLEAAGSLLRRARGLGNWRFDSRAA